MNLQSAFNAFAHQPVKPASTNQPLEVKLEQSKKSLDPFDQTLYFEKAEEGHDEKYQSYKEQLFQERNAKKLLDALKLKKITLSRKDKQRVYEICKERPLVEAPCTIRYINLPLDATTKQMGDMVDYVLGEDSTLKIEAVFVQACPATVFDTKSRTTQPREGYTSYPTKSLAIRFQRAPTDEEFRRLKVLKYGDRVIFAQKNGNVHAQLNQQQSIFVDRFQHNSNINAIILYIMDFAKSIQPSNRIDDLRLFFDQNGVMKGCLLLEFESPLSIELKNALYNKEIELETFERPVRIMKCQPEKIATRNTQHKDRQREREGDKVQRDERFMKKANAVSAIRPKGFATNTRVLKRQSRRGNDQ